MSDLKERERILDIYGKVTLAYGVTHDSALEAMKAYLDKRELIHRKESLSEKAHRLIHELSFILPDLDQSLHDIISKES